MPCWLVAGLCVLGGVSILATWIGTAAILFRRDYDRAGFCVIFIPLILSVLVVTYIDLHRALCQ